MFKKYKKNINDYTKESLIEYNRFINNILLDDNNLYNFDNIDNFMEINSEIFGGIKYHLKITKNKVKILYKKRIY